MKRIDVLPFAVGGVIGVWLVVTALGEGYPQWIHDLRKRPRGRKRLWWLEPH